jgi:hypothetical protein
VFGEQLEHLPAEVGKLLDGSLRPIPQEYFEFAEGQFNGFEVRRVRGK